MKSDVPRVGEVTEKSRGLVQSTSQEAPAFNKGHSKEKVSLKEVESGWLKKSEAFGVLKHCENHRNSFNMLLRNQ